MIRNAIVISPHPDDESIGAGGYLLKLNSEGCSIHWLNITHMSEKYGYSQEQVVARDAQMKRVRQAYGFQSFHNLCLKPAGLDQVDMAQMVGLIKNVLEEVRPELVILPYKYDVHSDHGVVFDAVYSCIKSFRAPYVKKAICMEILSETDQAVECSAFSPNMFVDITDFMNKKIEILENYVSEIKSPPFPRNIEAIKGLASYRGATAYCRYAEAYRIIKEYC